MAPRNFKCPTLHQQQATADATEITRHRSKQQEVGNGIKCISMPEIWHLWLSAAAAAKREASTVAICTVAICHADSLQVVIALWLLSRLSWCRLCRLTVVLNSAVQCSFLQVLQQLNIGAQCTG